MIVVMVFLLCLFLNFLTRVMLIMHYHYQIAEPNFDYTFTITSEFYTALFL